MRHKVWVVGLSVLLFSQVVYAELPPDIKEELSKVKPKPVKHHRAKKSEQKQEKQEVILPSPEELPVSTPPTFDAQSKTLTEKLNEFSTSEAVRLSQQEQIEGGKIKYPEIDYQKLDGILKNEKEDTLLELAKNLVTKSESINNEDKQYWLNIVFPSMPSNGITRLVKMLFNEQIQVIAFNIKHKSEK